MAPSTGNRTLLAFFSRRGENYYYGGRRTLQLGNTEVLAGMIAERIDCDVYRIEEAEPGFQNSLITYLDLRRRRGELSPAALAAIEARAVGDLTKVEIDAVVDQRRLYQICYALATVVAAFCLLVWRQAASPAARAVRTARRLLEPHLPDR